MRRVFDRISERIRGFLQSRDYAMLAVRCLDEESIAVLKIIEELDESATSEWFWTFQQGFAEPAEYVSAVVKDFATQHSGVAIVQKMRKQPEWPPIPEAILDDSAAPVSRLRELMTFSRSLLGHEGARAIWVLFPLEIKNPEAYAAFLSQLMEHEFPFPWFHHIRMIARDAPLLTEMRCVDFYTPDLSAEAMDQALEEDASDPQLPLAQRIQALFLSAQRDAAYGKFEEALKKHEVVLKFHSAAGNGAMTALVLNSVGEIHQRDGRPHQAEQCFSAALEPACQGPYPPVPVLYNSVVNLAETRLIQGHFEQAEPFYESAEQLATVQRDPRAKLQAIEKMGLCQAMQGKHEEAVASWRRGAELAAKLENPDLQLTMLQRLRELFAVAGQRIEQQEVEDQLAALELG
jgi:tetratricopeptide (TPR) repeat protein